MLLATLLAPATRFGYLMYPANLFVWAYLLDGMVPTPLPSPAEEIAVPPGAVLDLGPATAVPG
jgi:hypothetical protein